MYSAFLLIATSTESTFTLSRGVRGEPPPGTTCYDMYHLLWWISLTLVSVFSLITYCNKYQTYFYSYLFKLIKAGSQQSATVFTYSKYLMLSTEVFWPDTQRCLTSQYFRTRCGPITHQSSISRCLTERCLTFGIYCNVRRLWPQNYIVYLST